MKLFIKRDGVIVDPERYKWRVLGGAMVGYIFDAADFMVLAMIIPPIIQEWNVSLAAAGSIAMATLFGAAIGAYIWGPVSDKIGRKYSLAMCITVFSILSFCCGLSQTWEQLITLRFIAGMGLGGAWVLGAALITEYFPPHQRARGTTAVQAAWPIGYAMVVVANLFITPVYGWRALFFFGALGIFVAIYTLIFVPESPVWLKARENRKKGIISAESTNVAKAASWLELFKGPNLKVTLLCTALCTCILVSYWGTGAWIPAFLAQERDLNIRGLTWFLLAQQGGAFLSFVIFGYVGDKVGRRSVFIIGGITSAITVILYMLAPTPGLIFAAGVLWLFAATIFWGPLGATIGEQFSSNIRGIGISVAYGTGRIAAALAPFLMGGLADRYSLAFAIGLMAVFYLGITILGYVMRETKDTIVVD